MGAPELVAAVRAQIRAERAAADLSRNKLADAAGVSVMTIRRMEGADPHRPDVTPDVEQLAAVCAVFGIPVSALFTRAEDRVERHAAPASGVDVEDDVYVTPPSEPPPDRGRRTRSPRSAGR